MNMRALVLALFAVVSLVCAPASAQTDYLGDPDMEDAIEEARNFLPQFWSAYDQADGWVRAEGFKLKVGIPIPDEPDLKEYIWVSNIQRGPGETWTGRVTSQPAYVKRLSLDSEVSFTSEQIGDWSIYTPIGLYGAFTTRRMLEDWPPELAKIQSRELAPTPVPPAWKNK